MWLVVLNICIHSLFFIIISNNSIKLLFYFYFFLILNFLNRGEKIILSIKDDYVVHAKIYDFTKIIGFTNTENPMQYYYNDLYSFGMVK